MQAYSTPRTMRQLCRQAMSWLLVSLFLASAAQASRIKEVAAV